jgi:CheY-like chemotaxis protein
MTEKKFPIELDSKFLNNLYGLINTSPPEEITLENLNEVVIKIKSKLNNIKSSSMEKNSIIASGAISDDSDDSSSRPKTVLIVDDLGIITYQLDILFKKIGFEVVISQEINDAIDKYKKQDFGYAVIDLFIPTEREGFILLDELKKLALLCKLNTRIIVMTASSKLEYQDKCLNRGADFYIEKSPGWQSRIMECCTSK